MVQWMIQYQTIHSMLFGDANYPLGSSGCCRRWRLDDDVGLVRGGLKEQYQYCTLPDYSTIGCAALQGQKDLCPDTESRGVVGSLGWWTVMLTKTQDSDRRSIISPSSVFYGE